MSGSGSGAGGSISVKRIELPPMIKLGKDNWEAWDAMQQVVCDLNNVKYCYMGTAAPADADPIRDEKIARYIVMAGLSEDDLANTLTLTSANAIREDLKKTRQGRVTARLASLQLEFYGMKKQSSESMEDYIKRAVRLQREFKEVGKDIDDTELCVTILNGLVDIPDYSQIRDLLLRAEPLQLTDVKSTLLRKEVELGGSKRGQSSNGDKPIDTAQAFHVHGRGGRGGRGGGRGGRPRGDGGRYGGRGGRGDWGVQKRRGGGGNGFHSGGGRGGGRRAGRGGRHGGRGGSQGGRGGRGGRDQGYKTSRQYVKCWNCNKMGHFQDECREPQKDRGQAHMAQLLPPHLRSNDIPTGAGTSGQAFMTGDTYVTGENRDPYYWILDGAASHHMTPCFDLLTDYKEEPCEVEVATGFVCERKGVGTIRAQTVINGRTNYISIPDVWYVPDLAYSLLSLNTLCEKGCSYIGGEQGCVVFDKHKQPIINCPKINRLLRPEWSVAVQVGKAFSAHKTTETAELWHQRLGHVNYEVLTRMVNEGLVNGVNITASQFRKASHNQCEVCIQGKYARKPFLPSERVTTRPCELLHMDVCVYEERTLGGKKYALTVLDDFTDYCGVVTMAEKSEVKKIIPNLIWQWEKRSGELVDTVRSDRGGEFLNQELDDYFASKNITHEFSAPYTHEQNGKAERLNRTINDKVRCMLIQYKWLTKKLWGEALYYAALLRNVCLVKRLNKTPYQAFLKEVPNVSSLRTFGCKVYAWIPTENRKKLDPKCELGYYMGPEPNTKACRVLVPQSRGSPKIKVSRDIVTLESLTDCTDLQTFAEQLEGVPEVRGRVLTGTEEAPFSFEVPYPGVTQRGNGQFGVSVQPSVTATGTNHQPQTGSLSQQETANVGERDPPPQGASGSGHGHTANVGERDPPPQGASGSSHRRGRGRPSRSVQIEQGGPSGPVQQGPTGDPSDGQGGGSAPDQAGGERSKRQRREPERFDKDPSMYTARKGTVSAQFVVSGKGTVYAVLKVDKDDVPSTYTQAINHPFADKWMEALVDEIKSLHANQTWRLVKRQPWMKVIPSKWVFKIKTDELGLPYKFKCRLVAGGHRQSYGVDYDETFAPVSRHTTLRVFLSVAANRGWKVHQLDVKTAFLHGDIDVDVYMEQPDGFVEGTNLVCLLQKCLYGLKQAPRAWYEKLTGFLSELGFVRVSADTSLWVCRGSSTVVYLLMVVDDILVMSPKESKTLEVVNNILGRFDGTPHGVPKHYIGIKIDWIPEERAVVLTQPAHIDDLLKKFGLADCQPRSLPQGTGVKLRKRGKKLDTAVFPYASLVGALLFIAVCTRPDIAQIVAKLARYMTNPTWDHWVCAVNLVRYLKATKHYGIKLGNGEGLVAYCDSDYASCEDTRKSTTGYVFLLFGGAISWQSKMQPTVAASNTEAEYMACSAAAREALWLRQLLPNFGVECTPLLIRGDSQGALGAIRNHTVTARTKHIDIIHQFVRDRYSMGQLDLEHVAGSQNLADVLTKPVPGPKHKFCCDGMGMYSFGAAQ
jgi:transposase InsO family protein